jgi:hypothetical protein
VRSLWLLVVEVPAGHRRGGVVADGQPGLGHRTQRQILGCVRTAHLGGDPARLECVGADAGPAAGEGEGEDDVVELAVGVGLRAVPTPVRPLRVLQAGVTAAV